MAVLVALHISLRSLDVFVVTELMAWRLSATRTAQFTFRRAVPHAFSGSKALTAPGRILRCITVAVHAGHPAGHQETSG